MNKSGACVEPWGAPNFTFDEDEANRKLMWK